MKNERMVRSVVVMALVLGWANAGLCAQPVAGKPLADATLLNGVDGKLVHADANDAWWFEFTAPVKSDKYEIPAGTRMMLLPSGTLERVIVDVNDRYAPLYRLSAQVTRYQGINFLLATYFLPLSKFKGDETAGDRESKPGDNVVSPPVDPDLGIPPEIVERLKNARPVHGPLRKPDESNRVSKPVARDYLGRMLVNQAGLIQASDRRPEAGGGYGYFVPYALGWSVSDARYELLPCAALEEARRLQSASIETIRFNVAGLVTQFGGRQYLLLQRATPVYNYGNFGR